MRDPQGHPHAPAGAAASTELSGPDPDLEAIERVSIHFWRPHEQRMIGGWIWRYSNGGSQRANSVATLDEPGMDLDEALRRVTATPAQFLKMSDDIGTLRPSAIADIVVLELQEGEFEMTDAFGVTETVRRHLEPRYVFRAGRQIGVLPRPESSGDYFKPPALPPSA